MDEFVVLPKPPKLNKDQINNLSRSIANTKTKMVTKSLPNENAHIRQIHSRPLPDIQRRTTKEGKKEVCYFYEKKWK